MHPSERAAELKKRGSSAAAIAKTLGLTRDSVSKTIRGESKSAKIVQAVSEALGFPPERIWPEWYGGHATTAQMHATIDPQLVGEIRAAMRMYGLAKGCTLPYAIPRLRHVIQVYNAVARKLTGNESVGESAKALEAAIADYALALTDPDDPAMFARNWWEPLDSFKNQ